MTLIDRKLYEHSYNHTGDTTCVYMYSTCRDHGFYIMVSWSHIYVFEPTHINYYTDEYVSSIVRKKSEKSVTHAH